MPHITWETIIGALAVVALVAGAQYIRPSAAAKPVQEQVEKLVGSGGKKKSKGKKAGGGGAAGGAAGGGETPAAPSSASGSSYADIAQAAVEKPVDPVPQKTTKKKKTKSKPEVAPTEPQPSPVAPPAARSPPVEPDTSNDASLAAALSEEHDDPSSSSSSSSEGEAEPVPAQTTKSRAGEWEKPKKVVGGPSGERAVPWESVSASRGITSTNRFSALSSPASAATGHKKPVPRSTTGTGKHRIDESSSATPTKLQKKNAASVAAKKAAKEAEEKERLERLARYRREQEKEKISALYGKPKAKGVSVAANNRSLSNGMNASVDMGGKLVWD